MEEQYLPTRLSLIRDVWNALKIDYYVPCRQTEKELEEKLEQLINGQK